MLDSEIAGNPRAVDNERHRHLVEVLAPGRALENVPLFGSHLSSRGTLGASRAQCRVRRQHYSHWQDSPAARRARVLEMTMKSDDGRTLLRHTVATVAYRGGKVIRDAPDGFSEFRIGETSRTPGQILAHIGDLYDWALTMAEGPERWQNATPLAWSDESARFFSALRKFDERLGARDAAGLFDRTAVPGTGRRFTDAHRTDRDVASPCRCADACRELLRRGHRGRSSPRLARGYP